MNARPIPTIRRTADLLFTRKKVAVFVDGCYWHGCPQHYRAPAAHDEYWSSKLAKNLARDEATNRLLSEAGWLVIRVWEHELPTVAATRVEQALDSR